MHISQDMRKILVPVDGSKRADSAIRLSCFIAKKFNSRIDLIHVIHEGSDVETRKNARYDPEMLLARAKTKVSMSNISCQTILKRAYDISDEIVGIAKSGKYSLVAVGSSGVTGRKGLLLGSISSTVAAEADCSVLVAKRDFKSISKILFGYDGSKESKVALTFCEAFANKFHTTIDVIDVVLKRADASESHVDEALKYFRKHNIISDGKVIDSVDVGKAITYQAKRNGYKLIIVGSGKFSRLGSLILGNKAADVINNADTNVVIAR